MVLSLPCGINTRTESASGKSALPPIRGAIVFDAVNFRYRPDGPEVLRNVDLAIAPGEVIGIVGRSGSGKSTLAKLVQRLYIPERGRVLIDGIDLAQVDASSLRRQIGVVLQENVLFNRTIRENIALADPGMLLDAVMMAATAASPGERLRVLAAAASSRRITPAPLCSVWPTLASTVTRSRMPFA